MIDNVQIQHTGLAGQPDRLLLQRRPDGRNQLPDQLAARRSARRRRADQHDPRDGGNQFHGGLFVTGANESMQSDKSGRRARGASGSAPRTASTRSTTPNATFGDRRVNRSSLVLSPPLAANNTWQHLPPPVKAGARRPAYHRRDPCASRGSAERQEQADAPLRPQHQVARPSAQQLDRRRSTIRSCRWSRPRVSTTSARTAELR